MRPTRLNVARLVRLVAAALLAADAVQGQDTVASRPHALPVDTLRLQPFRATYDMFVYDGDSAIVIGERSVSLQASAYEGGPAWLLQEARTGLVPAAESLFLAGDLRPLHWSASLGDARLGAEFARDSMYAATSGPFGTQSIVLAVPSDLLLSSAMTECLLMTFPLSPFFQDSVSLLDVTLTSSGWAPGEVAVVGEEDLLEPSGSRPTWVVALRQVDRQGLYWVDKSTGLTLRSLQVLPPHAGRQLEYRLRPDSVSLSRP